MTGEHHNAFSQGPVISPEGVRFSLFSEHATLVELCLFESETARETRRISLERTEGHLWQGFVPGLEPGCRYGFRVFGPYKPQEGHRFNPSKVLADPYGRVLAQPPKWDRRWHSIPYDLPLDKEVKTRPDGADNAACAPLCRVVDTAFDWQDDAPPSIPWPDTIIYETHVKGITRQHPEVPPELRGTYAGLATEPVIEHLKALGVTAVELLPIHQGAEEQRLAALGLTNYWGYNTLLFFAPEIRLAATADPVREFKEMVRALHRAGLEVLLDVVYNHTVEGDSRGPTLCFKGVDNRTYYKLNPENPALYDDLTGCGNTLNIQHPQVLRLVLDSLRYWVTDMHVDGFRFDLGVVLGRTGQGFDPSAPFFQAVAQDPVLSKVKLIAEPWDLGPGGYQVSGFPNGWSEWNDQYRQTVRRFWRGDPGQVGLFAQRLCGSRDIYEPKARPPHSSINYVTCHDGFTLQDLVSYRNKHNEANRENNRDGNNDNASCNHGVEGATRRTDIQQIRTRHMKNLMATLMLSMGTPMLLGGDEIRRSQRGNNNAYCQDSPISWYDWHLDPDKQEFLEFTRKVIAFRKAHPLFRRDGYLHGKQEAGSPLKDVTWLRPDGKEMEQEDWDSPDWCYLGFILACPPDPGLPKATTAPLAGTLLVLMNADNVKHGWTLPGLDKSGRWETVFDTGILENSPAIPPNLEKPYWLKPQSMAVFEWK